MEPTNTAVSERGRFASLMPTDGRELIQAWELSPEAWANESVKISRQKPGSEQVELLESCTLEEYDLGTISREYGPGRYRITPGPGPNARKQVTINVSREFASRHGWAQAPEREGPGELMARRTWEQAQRGPVDPVSLGQMVELAVHKAMEGQRTQAKPDNGLGALELVLKGFDLAGSLQAKALETVRNMAGVPAAAQVEKEPASMADVLLQLGPSIMDTIKSVVTAPPPRQINPAQPRPVNPNPAPANIQPMEPRTVKQIQPDPELPAITDEEAQAIAPIVGLMKPHAEKLVPFLNGAWPASMLAGQLCGMMGPDLDGPAVSLAAVVNRVGPGILAAIHPDMANEKGADVVREIAARIMDAEGAADA